MALSEFDRKRTERLLDEFSRRRVPAHLRDQIRLGWAFRGDTVTLFEARPLLRNPAQWAESKIAQFRRVGQGWALHWQDRNGRWHAYQGLAPGRLEQLLAEVDRDPTGIFWG